MTMSAERRELLEKLEGKRAQLLEIVAQMSEDTLTRPRKPGDRSPKGQLLHMAEAEWHYVEGWARRARDEDAPDLGASNEPAPFQDPEGQEDSAPLYDEADDLSLSELLTRLDKARQNTLQFIQETRDDQFPRQGRNSPFGDLSVIQFLKSLYRHDEMHYDEVQGKESRYTVTTRDGQRL